MKPLLEVLQSGAAYLAKKGIEEARLNMEHLLAHVLHCRRMDLYLRFDQIVPESQLVDLRDLLRRRGEGEPLQHLLGTVEFFGAEFVCDHRALVPRPETEYLVEHLVQRLRSTPPPRVLDVGTGSGCIGLSLAKAWSNASVTLVDVSEDALELARLNGSRLNLDARITLRRSDLFEKITGEFDLIVANLPYIPHAEIAKLSREVQNDPVLALDGGPIGTEIIARFIAEVSKHLTPGGLVAMELGHDQAPAVSIMCREAGLVRIETLADLQGVPRFVLAHRSDVIVLSTDALPMAA